MWDEVCLLQAREDPHKRELFIAEHMGDISRYASKAAGRWIDGSDDLYSVALIAFNDAIATYEPERGRFAAFASRVIANRITDELRRTQKSQQVLPFSALDLVDRAGNVVSFDPVDSASEKSEAAWEIESLSQELKLFGISFFDLPDASPKSRKTKMRCKEVVQTIVEDPILVSLLYKTKKLPASRLSQFGDKLLERHRKYIIAGVLVCTGGYSILEEYFKGGV